MGEECCGNHAPSNKVFKSDWKDIVRKDDGWGQLDQEETGWGSEMRQKLSEGRFGEVDLDLIRDTDEEMFDQRFREGIECFYCNAAAEYKCVNGLRNGCAYRVEGVEGDKRNGVQVCGANSRFARENKDKYPEGHKSYALEYNSGHNFVSIEEYFELDPDAGWVNKNPRKDGGHYG
tara:strand:- start:383 stop:910 length:528 start_codon:yes stop_codon:yes gene_type:complete